MSKESFSSPDGRYYFVYDEKRDEWIEYDLGVKEKWGKEEGEQTFERLKPHFGDTWPVVFVITAIGCVIGLVVGTWELFSGKGWLIERFLMCFVSIIFCSVPAFIIGLVVNFIVLLFRKIFKKLF